MAIYIAGLLLLSAPSLAADEPSAPHPVHHPESSLMLAGDWVPEDPHDIDFSKLPRVPAKHAVISDVRAQKGVNQHNYLVHHHGRFFAMWSDGPGVEDRVGQRVKFATSPDGLNWNEPRFLTPEPPNSGPDSPHYGTRTEQGLRWISRGFWQRGNQLYALASLDEAAGFFGPSLQLHAFQLNPNDETWKVAGVIADDTINNFPPKQLPTGEWMMSRRPHNYKSTGVQFLVGGTKAIDDWESFPVLGTNSELAAEEPLWWRLPDYNLTALFRDNRGSKLLYRSFSTDNGQSWSMPVRTNFPDATSKLHGLRLSDGRYVLVSNSNPKKRDPLTIAISDDGMVFHKLGYLVGGRHVDYPHVIEHDRHLLVAFAGGKQTVEVLKIRLDDLDQALAEEAEKPLEGELAAFLGEPKLHLQTLFDDERFPNITVALDGTVLATWGNQHVRARRSEDGGESWGDEITIANPGVQGGGTTVDETTGDVLAFVETHHPPAPLTIYRSQDHGKSWQAQQKTAIKPDSRGNLPSMHMNEHGITLRHGPHKGRLLRPTRYYAGGNKREEWPNHYTNAIYSDDGGKTWQTSEPFPENGTGEATLAELSDGRICYNSRVHWQERPKNTRRRCAWSDDGGVTWKDWSVVEVLPDGHQHRSYGCMGGLVRLPVKGKDILVFSNIDTPNPKRERATVWASFDGGKTWPVKRLVDDGPSAYSSLTAGRPGTPSESWIYLHFEAGKGSKVARFNLAWLSEGESTGDGELPDWVKPSSSAQLEPLPYNRPGLVVDHGAHGPSPLRPGGA